MSRGPVRVGGAVVVLVAVVVLGGCAAMERNQQIESSRPRVLGATAEGPLVPSRVPTAPSTTAPAASPPTTTVPVAIPTTTPPPVGTAPGSASDARVDAALALVQFDWSDVLRGWTLAFEGPRAGYQGSTFLHDKRIEIYVRSSSTVPQLAHVIAHELGHAVDVTYFDDADRGTFDLLRGRAADAAWWVESGQTDFASGAGDWAESFSWWATGGVGKWESRLGRAPNALQLDAIGQLVAASITR